MKWLIIFGLVLLVGCGAPSPGFERMEFKCYDPYDEVSIPSDDYFILDAQIDYNKDCVQKDRYMENAQNYCVFYGMANGLDDLAVADSPSFKGDCEV
ncbi:hypothetical protein ACFLZX_04080 [Nanoarchaeota archaeon]